MRRKLQKCDKPPPQVIKAQNSSEEKGKGCSKLVVLSKIILNVTVRGVRARILPRAGCVSCVRHLRHCGLFIQQLVMEIFARDRGQLSPLCLQWTNVHCTIICINAPVSGNQVQGNCYSPPLFAPLDCHLTGICLVSE